MFQGDYAAAKPPIEESLALYRGLRDKNGVAYCLANLGFVAVLGQRDLGSVLALLGEATELKPGLTDRRATAYLLIFVGLVAASGGEPERARALHEEGLALCREIKDLQGTSMCLTDWGLTEMAYADHARATELLRENLRLGSASDFKNAIQWSFVGLAGVALGQGQPARAARLWGLPKPCAGSGKATFSFDTPNAPLGEFVTATVTNQATKDTSEFSAAVEVVPGNVAPVAKDQKGADAVTTEEDAPKLITLSATDEDDDALTYEITDLPDHGKLYRGDSTAQGDEISLGVDNEPYSLPDNGNKVTYVPDRDYSNSSDNPDGFRFLANDGTENSNEATVSILVEPAKDTAEIELGGLVHTYDGTPKAATATTDPSELKVDLAYSRDGAPVDSPTAAGSYDVVATIDDPDHEGRQTGTLVIEKAPLTVRAGDASRVYGEENPTFTAGYSGFVDGEDESDLTGALRFDTEATASSPVGSYDVMPGGLTSNNYEISFQEGTLTITKATAKITLGDLAHVYGGTPKAATATTEPRGLRVNIAYSQNGIPVENPTGIGSYDVVATVEDANYRGEGTVPSSSRTRRPPGRRSRPAPTARPGTTSRPSPSAASTT